MTSYKKLIICTLKHAKAIVITTAVISLFLAFFAVKIELNPDVGALLPADDPSNVNFQDYSNNGEFVESFMFLVSGGEELYDPENLAVLYHAVEQVEAYENIATGVHPFSMVTAEKRGTRLALTPMSVVKDPSRWTEEEAVSFRTLLTEDHLAKNLIVSEDGYSLLFYFPAYIVDDENSAQMKEIAEILEPVEEFAEVALNGGLFFTDRVLYYLESDIVLLLSLSIVVILLIYYISFKAKRAVFLPMTVVIFGAIWSLAIVTFLGYELTVINIITPVLILTLGSSYSIHLLSDYYRTHPKKLEGGNKDWIIDVVSHISRTVLIAGLTTVAGFLSLLATRIPEFRQFGISTSIGILVCVLLTLFYLPALLVLLPNPHISYYEKVVGGPLSKLIKGFGFLVIRRWYVFLGIFALTIGGFIYSYPRVNYDTSFVKYYPKKEIAIVNLEKIATRIGGVDSLNITIKAPEGTDRYFLNSEVLAAVDRFESAMISQPEISHTLSFVQYLKFFNGIMTGEEVLPDSPGLTMLLARYFGLLSDRSIGNGDIQYLYNEDDNNITISFRYTHEDGISRSNLIGAEHLIDMLEIFGDTYLPDECEVVIWGPVQRFLSLSSLIELDQRTSTLISMAIVFLVTWINFRSFKFGVLSLFPILFGIMMNFIVMYLFGIPFDTVTIAFASVTVGVGVDDAVHFILRFQSLYHYRSGSLLPAVKRTIELTGRPIILTTLSILGGLLVLTAANFLPIRNFGLLISLSLFNTLLATLFLLPSGLILWIGTERLIKKRLQKRRDLTR